jgi:tetratricopeptide (TPR) repeat protein
MTTRTPLPLPALAMLLILLVTSFSRAPAACAQPADAAEAPDTLATAADTDAAPTAVALLRRARAQTADAYRAGDAAALRRARALAERATFDPAHAGRAHYYVALADYRLVAFLRGADDDAWKAMLDDGVAHAEAAVAARPGDGEAHALLASLYGWKASQGMLSGMRYGPKSSSAMEDAMRLAPASPRVILLDAIGTFNKPSLFGGDKAAALDGFRRAADRFAAEAAAHEADASDADPLAPRWGHADAYAWIGLAHLEADRPDAARRAFEQALEVAPGFAWVKEVLLPQVD